MYTYHRYNKNKAHVLYLYGGPKSKSACDVRMHVGSDGPFACFHMPECFLDFLNQVRISMSFRVFWTSQATYLFLTKDE